MGDVVRRVRRRVAALTPVVFAAVALGCSDEGSNLDAGDVGEPETGCLDAVLPFERNPFDGIAAAFVIDSIRLGRPDDGEGFDLDCESTGPDSYVPLDGPHGVDNQFGAFAAAIRDAGLDLDVNRDMQRSVESGRNIILLRLVDVDDWVHDGGLVYLSAYKGVDADSDPTNNLTGRGELLVDDASLVAPDDLLSARAWFGDGVLDDTITDGRIDMGDFTASGADVVLEFTVNDTVATLPLHDAHVLWDTDAIPSGDPPVDGRIVGGLLGGSVPLRAGVDFIMAVYRGELGSWGTGIDEATVRTVASGQADIDAIPAGFTDSPCTEATLQDDCAAGQWCEQDSARGNALYCCEYDENPDAISVAFVFTAVSCDIVGIHHGAP